MVAVIGTSLLRLPSASGVTVSIGIDVEFRRAMTAGSSRPALRRRSQEELFAGVFTGREIWEGLIVAHRHGPAVIVSGVEGLNAANKLGQGSLDLRLVNSGRAESHRKEHAIFMDGGKLRQKFSEPRVAVRAAKPHLDVIPDGLSRLIFQAGGALVPEKSRLSPESTIDEPGRMPHCREFRPGW